MMPKTQAHVAERVEKAVTVMSKVVTTRCHCSRSAGAHFGASRVTLDIAVELLDSTEDLLSLHFLAELPSAASERACQSCRGSPIGGVAAGVSKSLQAGTPQRTHHDCLCLRQLRNG
jgi:hypothetical protein